jgi:porT protein
MDYTPGFSVGLIADYTIKLNWELRFVPTLHLSERSISFSDGENQIERFSSRSNLIEFPLLLKYSSQRMNNIRPYMLAGGYAALQIGQKRGDVIHFKPLEYGLKVGIGCDIYLPFFKLCPELSLSYGLGDAIQHERPDIADDARYQFTQALRSATPRMILLTFHFE